MSNCKWCDTEFQPKRSDNYFCSASCRCKYNHIFKREKTADADFWAVTTPYGAHGFDGLVASWLRSSSISGSTLCGV